MRKIRGVWALIGALVLAIGIAGGAVLLFAKSNAQLKVGQDLAHFGDEIVSKVCKDWDTDALISVATPSVRARPRERGAAMMDIWKSTYGALVSGAGNIESYATDETVDGVKTPRAFYVCEAVFSKSNATIRIEFDRQGDSQWQVQEFSIEPR